MLSVAESISDLLFLNDLVVVPGLGAFVRSDVSPAVNVITHQFRKPKATLSFDANLREENDLIANYMSSCSNTTLGEARQRVLLFVSESFATMKSGGTVALTDIGTLSLGPSNEVVFVPEGTVNYNPDAFGMDDFSAIPVFQTKTKDEIKANIEQQHKDKNTPMTVDKRAVHQDEEKTRTRPVWPWAVLALLLAVGCLSVLDYLNVIHIGAWEWVSDDKPAERRSGASTRDFVMYTYPLDTDTSSVAPPWTLPYGWNDTTAVSGVEATASVASPESQEAVQVKAPEPVSETVSEGQESRFVIVLGCFSTEENALVMMETVKDKGVATAFVAQRGKLWDVCSGGYATMDEAKHAIREVREITGVKAWILQKK